MADPLNHVKKNVLRPAYSLHLCIDKHIVCNDIIFISLWLLLFANIPETIYSSHILLFACILHHWPAFTGLERKIGGEKIDSLSLIL